MNMCGSKSILHVLTSWRVFATFNHIIASTLWRSHMLEEEETLTPVVASTALSMLRWWKFQKSVCPSCVKLFKMLVLGGVTILSYKEQYMPKGHQG